MPKYRLDTAEFWSRVAHVEADNLEQALEKVWNNDESVVWDERIYQGTDEVTGWVILPEDRKVGNNGNTLDN